MGNFVSMSGQESGRFVDGERVAPPHPTDAINRVPITRAINRLKKMLCRFSSVEQDMLFCPGEKINEKTGDMTTIMILFIFALLAEEVAIHCVRRRDPIYRVRWSGVGARFCQFGCPHKNSHQSHGIGPLRLAQ
mgnify:CR=1 FL=1